MALGETKQPPERMEESVGCVADRARLLDADSEPEQTDPVAVRATIASYLEDIDSYMRSLEVRVSRFPFSNVVFLRWG
jgi:hypothetical protein